jgi:hypothetical protein
MPFHSCPPSHLLQLLHAIHNGESNVLTQKQRECTRIVIACAHFLTCYDLLWWKTSVISECIYNRSTTNLAQSYPRNRPRRPIGSWNTEVPILSRKSAHRWGWGCQSYASATLYTQADSWYSFLLEVETITAGRKSNNRISNRTRDLPACSTVPRPTTLPHAPPCLNYKKESINVVKGSSRCLFPRITWNIYTIWTKW